MTAAAGRAQVHSSVRNAGGQCWRGAWDPDRSKCKMTQCCGCIWHIGARSVDLFATQALLLLLLLLLVMRICDCESTGQQSPIVPGRTHSRIRSSR
jgi:hypothetical protein